MLGLSGAWACVMTLIGVMALCSGNPLTGIIIVAVNWIPYYLVKWSAVRSEANAKARLMASFNSPPSFIHVERGTGIALFAREQRIAVLDRKRLKSYAYPDLRDWTIPERPAGRFKASEDPGRLRKAPRNAWLHLRISDLDHPEWRINMLNKPDRQRWFEILTQEVNVSAARIAFADSEETTSLTA